MENISEALKTNLKNLIDNKNSIILDTKAWLFEILSRLGKCDKEIFLYINSIFLLQNQYFIWNCKIKFVYLHC